MFEFIKRRGSVSFDALMRRELGKDYGYDEKAEAELMVRLEKLISSGAIEASRSPAGHTSYRIPLEKISKKEFDPVVRMMSRVADPEGAKRLFDEVIKFMDEDGFTVNGVFKAQADGLKLPRNKVQDLMDELTQNGQIAATKSKKYMGRMYNIYEVVGPIEKPARKKRKVSQG